MDRIKDILGQLGISANLRRIPDKDTDKDIIDLTSNDYLGIAANHDFIQNFFDSLHPSDFIPTSSASRLLASRQSEYHALEDALSAEYGRPALLFNSGYHANTGIVRALADKQTLFIADKLVHASIIDGLSMASTAGATFMRFRHNDFAHLHSIMERHGKSFRRIVIIAESVYSMDGDTTNIDELIKARDLHPNALIYLDEAHSIGVIGSQGLGMARNHPSYDKIDIIVGTFGKALASMGAFAVTSPLIHDYLVNTCRSLIFSTALPPVTMRWSLATFRYSLGADEWRAKLRQLGDLLAQILGNNTPSHIQPLIIGDARRAVEASQRLLEHGYRVLPIRTPTVSAGTERLRFSLSASINPSDLSALQSILSTSSVGG